MLRWKSVPRSTAINLETPFIGAFLTPRPFMDEFCILVLAASSIGEIDFIQDSVLLLSWIENPLVG